MHISQTSPTSTVSTKDLCHIWANCLLKRCPWLWCGLSMATLILLPETEWAGRKVWVTGSGRHFANVLRTVFTVCQGPSLVLINREPGSGADLYQLSLPLSVFVTPPSWPEMPILHPTAIYHKIELIELGGIRVRHVEWSVLGQPPLNWVCIKHWLGSSLGWDKLWARVYFALCWNKFSKNQLQPSPSSLFNHLQKGALYGRYSLRLTGLRRGGGRLEWPFPNSLWQSSKSAHLWDIRTLIDLPERKDAILS